MLSIKCPIPDCPYKTPESSEAVTCALLAAHSTIHMAGPPRAAVVIKGPKLDRLDTIQEGFPDDRRAANDDIAAFWIYRDSLNVTDGDILYRDRVVVPPSLRDKVLRILRSANQEVSSMESRARSIVF